MGRYRVVVLAVCIALAFWLADALLDYYVFYEGTFWGLLITNVPPRVLYVRAGAVAAILLLGLLGLRMLERRRRMEERIRHLNAVLEGIRSVSQLIVRERNRDRLLHVACGDLVATRGYCAAWVVVLDDGQRGSGVADINGDDLEFLHYPYPQKLEHGRDGFPRDRTRFVCDLGPPETPVRSVRPSRRR